MARIRTFKPEFLRHEELQTLELKHIGKYPMFVFMGLWAVCDKQGVFPWKPLSLKLDIYPFLKFDMEETLNILLESGFIQKFIADNNNLYGYVINFEKHQRINGIEAKNPAKYPSPDLEAHEKHMRSNQDTTEKQSIDREREMEMNKGKDTGDSAVANGSNEPPPSVNISESQNQALELSKLILKLHRDEFPDYLVGKKDTETISRWAVDIEKLIRIDKKVPENIRNVINWVKTPGNFWFPNIESGKKLREKFERLWGQMVISKTGNDHPEKNSFIPNSEQTNDLLKEYEENKKNSSEGLSLKAEFKKVKSKGNTAGNLRKTKGDK